MPSSHKARQSLKTSSTELASIEPPALPAAASLNESNLNANQANITKPPTNIDLEVNTHQKHCVDIGILNNTTMVMAQKSPKSASHSKNNIHRMPPQSPSSPTASSLLPPTTDGQFATPSTLTPKKKKKSIRRRFKKMFHSSKKSSGSHVNDTDSTTISSSCLASVKTFGTIELDSEQGAVDDLDYIQDYEDFYQENKLKEAPPSPMVDMAPTALFSSQRVEELGKCQESQDKSVSSSFLIGGTISLGPQGESPRVRTFTEDSLRVGDEQEEEKSIPKPTHISQGDIVVNNQDKNATSDGPPPSSDYSSPVEQIESLTEQGRIYYRYKLYNDALQVLQEAMDLIPTSSHDQDVNDREEKDLNPFWKMQKATINYQITKVQYKKTLEKTADTTATNTKTEETENGEKQDESQALDETVDEQRLYQQLQNEKYKVHTSSIAYYKDELIRMHKGKDSEDADTTNECKDVDFVDMDVTNLEKVCHTLYLLHSIGKLYDKNLSLYTKALEYYSQALTLENRVLRNLQSKQEQNINRDGNTSANEADLKEYKQWKMNARLTRKKMGKLYYITGQMNMALKSSFTSDVV